MKSDVTVSKDCGSHHYALQNFFMMSRICAQVFCLIASLETPLATVPVPRYIIKEHVSGEFGREGEADDICLEPSWA